MSAQKNDIEDVETSEESIKPSEYVRELLKEKLSLNPDQHGNAMRLLDQGLFSLYLFKSNGMTTM
jgi:hypothetical protein